MVHDIIEQEFRALESIVANPGISHMEKTHALKQYERILSKHTGITLRALKETAHIIHYEGLNKKQTLNELRAVENVFVEGAIKTSKEAGKSLSRKQCRKIFSNYVNQHFHIKIGRELKNARLARAQKKKAQKRALEQPKRPRLK